MYEQVSYNVVDTVAKAIWTIAAGKSRIEEEGAWSVVRGLSCRSRGTSPSVNSPMRSGAPSTIRYLSGSQLRVCHGLLLAPGVPNMTKSNRTVSGAPLLMMRTATLLTVPLFRDVAMTRKKMSSAAETNWTSFAKGTVLLGPPQILCRCASLLWSNHLVCTWHTWWSFQHQVHGLERKTMRLVNTPKTSYVGSRVQQCQRHPRTTGTARWRNVDSSEPFSCSWAIWSSVLLVCSALT